MADLRSKLPAPVRRTLGGLRRTAISTLGGSAAPPGPAPADGIPVDVMVELLFPGFVDQIPEAARKEAAPDGVVRHLAQLRRLLGATERQFAPSPVTVRFGADDVVVRQFESFALVLDTADSAVSRPIAERDVWEPHATAIFREYVQPNMTVVDVGANVGWFTMLAASLVGDGGRVVAVEPWSENCRLLLASLRLNRFNHVELWPVALDQTRRWAHFMTHVGSNGGLIAEDPDALASGRGTIVPTFAFDDLLGADERIDLIKIDVEGAEWRVVTGAVRSLERCRPVVFSEFSTDMTRRVSGIDPIEYPRWFTDRGWSLSVVDRDTGRLRPFATPEALLAWWPDDLHQEDLLFLPGRR